MWSDQRNCNWNIWGYNLTSEAEFPVTQISIVVYDKYDEVAVYGYDLETNTEFQISSSGVMPEWVKINKEGTFSVWQDYRNGNGDIYAYDFIRETEFAIATGFGDYLHSSITGNTVVW